MLLALLLQEFVRQHPSDHIDSETRKYLDDVTVLRLGYSISFNRYMPIGSYSEAGNLCNRLAMEMSSRRSNFEEMTSLSMEYGCKIDIELVIPTLLPPPLPLLLPAPSSPSGLSKSKKAKMRRVTSEHPLIRCLGNDGRQREE